ncbi:lipase family protein [Mycolicibacterium pulveris]|uniref:lipase family protein n=1 Tax=Mycolicibacterium pulveris TaxID=36813 RepID=UPI003CF181B5
MSRAHLNIAGIGLACLLVVTGAVVSGCADDTSAQTPPSMSGMRIDADYRGAGQEPGALAQANSLPTIDRRLRGASSLAARIEYTSTSGIDNQLTRVSGSVFVPNGDAPDGGWPIVAYAHATTGIEASCAPSLSPSLLGTSHVVTALVDAGFVVTVPDYQGLGVDDRDHPYLDSTTAGYNVIDSVRAARRLVPEASDRWVAIGVSQGGQATWAANELAAGYGAGLALLGTVSVAPAVDVAGLADAAAAGQLTPEQLPALVVILESLHRTHPDFAIEEYRRGFAKDHWDTLIACDGPEAAERAALTPRLTGEDLRPSTPQAVDALRALLQHMSLPKRPTTAPMLVLYGGNDALVLPQWTDTALRAACAMGDVIDIVPQPDRGHADIDVSSAFGWVNARFRGEPAPDSCLSLAPPGAPQ